MVKIFFIAFKDVVVQIKRGASEEDVLDLISSYGLNPCCEDELMGKITRGELDIFGHYMMAPIVCASCNNRNIGHDIGKILISIKEDYDTSTLLLEMGTITQEDENRMKSSTIQRILDHYKYFNPCCRANVLGQIQMAYPLYDDIPELPGAPKRTQQGVPGGLRSTDIKKYKGVKYVSSYQLES